ncbi:DUF4349 domain-containing protein [Kitasatospora sp. McL0602]|uniref:DUF4349 domain-containing protein n=1 Tax=Kitasatospora sp. McL0602 TaxID=3439530 RepID=UPI003F89B80C
MAYARARLAAAGLAVGVAVLVGGCSSSGGSASTAAAKAPAALAPGDAPKAAGSAAKPGVGGPGTGGSGTASVAPVGTAVGARKLAYSGQLSVQVEDVPRAVTAAHAVLAGSGDAYLADEETAPVTDGGSKPPYARLTLKVPSAGYDRTLDELSRLGRVLSRQSRAEDLTQQVADVDSRLKSQQASVERVRALMGEAKSLPDVVTLEAELGRREADLESLQHQQQELAAQTSLSTVTLELQARGGATSAPAKHPEGFWQAVGSGLAGGWHALVTVLRGIAVTLAAVAPFLLVLAPLGWMVRRLRAKRPAPELPQRELPQTEDLP